MAIRGKNYAGYNIMQVDASTNPVCKAGTTVLADDGNFYRYVYNASATTTVAAYRAVMKTAIAATDFQVLLANGALRPFAGGIAVTTIGPTEFGWVTVRGEATGIYTSACATTGLPLTMVTAGYLANGATDLPSPYCCGGIVTTTGTNVIKVDVW